ncbi:hypothetical protein ACFRKE_31980 [Kitasatospora indigofera]|uniref:hypothetical protein n=1 Tax=Kitasatospora indigofera TaxID=67307 RepID=UPI00367CE422
MGWFSRRWEPDFTFDAVVAGGIAYDVWTDEDGVVHLDEDYDPDLVIVPDGVVIGDYVYPAYLGDDGRLYLDEDDED